MSNSKSKSIKRDIQVLSKILGNLENIINAMRQYNLDFSSGQRGLCYNKVVFDACALYMAQVGENVKLLTDSSKRELDSVINTNLLRYFRNMIDHDYDNVNKIVLQGYIQQAVSSKVIVKVKERLSYCIVKTKKH